MNERIQTDRNDDPAATERALAQATAEPRPLRVLVPVAFGPGSQAALRHAERLARQKVDVRIHLLHVFDVPPAMGSQGTTAMRAMLEVEQDARDRLAAWARDVSVDATTAYRVGDPAGVITRCASELGADRIVMGAHRRPGPGPVGSTARDVRRGADCPVDLVVETGWYVAS